jgi:hypothetical protein
MIYSLWKFITWTIYSILYLIVNFFAYLFYLPWGKKLYDQAMERTKTYDRPGNLLWGLLCFMVTALVAVVLLNVIFI